MGRFGNRPISWYETSFNWFLKGMYHSVYETLTPKQRVIVSYKGQPYFNMVLITKPYSRTFENTFPQMSKSDILRKSTDIHRVLKDNECLIITKNKHPVWLIKRENNV